MNRRPGWMLVAVSLLATATPAAASGPKHGGALERRVSDLERENAELRRRLERLEHAASAPQPRDGARVDESIAAPVARDTTSRDAAVATAAPASAAAEANQTDDLGLGLIARYGSIRASFQIFGDAGFGYSDPSEPGVAHASFAVGSLDLFSTAQVGEHFQALSEVVFEGDSADNEFEVDLERLWGAWTFDDALYLKLGREHSPASRWNRRYHHGRWLWTSATQPFLARFEDDDGPLQVHQIGLEAGGRFATGAGTLEYAAVIANGRGRTPSEVTNFGDHNASKAFDVSLGFAPARIAGLGFGADLHGDEIPSIAGDPTRRHAIREFVETAYLEYFASPFEILGEAALIQHADRTSDRTFHHRTGYLQAGYHVDLFTPYLRLDLRDMSRGDPFYAPPDIDLDSWETVVGVRYDLNDAVALKLEGGIGRAQRRHSIGSTFTETFERFAAQLAWVF